MLDCDICFEKYDHSINKPLTLIYCGHTVCSQCFKRFKEKKCPTCQAKIETTATNWLALKSVATESEYDKLNSDLAKAQAKRSAQTMNKSFEKIIIENKTTKKQRNADTVKSLKSNVETIYNEAIKKMTENKRAAFKEIETAGSQTEKIAFASVPNWMDSNIEMKKSDVEDMFNLRKAQTDENLTAKEKKQKNIDFVKKVKAHIENQCNNMMKQMNDRKKKIFATIDIQGKEINKKLDELALMMDNKENEKLSQTKNENNDLKKEELIDLVNKINEQNLRLEIQMQNIVSYDQTIGFSINDEEIFKENFVDILIFKRRTEKETDRVKGKRNFPNGDKYIDELNQKGDPDGTGVYYKISGDKIEGQFQNCEPHGKCIYYSKTGQRYEGEIRDQNLNGKGKQYRADGRLEYDGDWLNGVRSGRGVQHYENGKIEYEGEWLDGRQNGRGISYLRSGNVYDGQWLNDKLHGFGILKWYDGDRYEGQFSNNIKAGNGIFYFSNGDIYIGEFKEDKMNGQGRLFIKGKGGFQGEFKAGKAFKGNYIFDQ